jgi:DedD protein
MPLPQFLQRFRPGATESLAQAPTLSEADIEQARVQARRRMIGMAVLVGVGVIGFPWLFETQPRPLTGGDVQVLSNVPQVAPPAPVVARAPIVGRVESATGAQPPAVSPASSAPLTEPASAPAKAVASPPDAPSSEALAKAAEAKAAAAAAAKARAEEKARQEAKAKAEAKKKAEQKAEQQADAKAKAEAKARAEAKAKAIADAKAKNEAKADPKVKPGDKAADKATETTRYIVQVGAFTDAATAQAARMKVERLGIKTYAQVIESPQGKKTRVRVGPFTNKAEAEKVMATLKKAGLTAGMLTL